MIRARAGLGLVEVGQAELAFLSVMIGEQAIHPTMSGIGAEDQVRPLDGLVLMTMIHQPARRGEIGRAHV